MPQGDSVVNKLSRFEESILKLEKSRKSEVNVFRPAVVEPIPTAAPVVVVESALDGNFVSSNSANYTLTAKSSVLSPSSTSAAASYRGLSGPSSGSVSSSNSISSGVQRKGPLVFPKRQTPPVPASKSTVSSSQ